MTTAFTQNRNMATETCTELERGEEMERKQLSRNQEERPGTDPFPVALEGPNPANTLTL